MLRKMAPWLCGFLILMTLSASHYALMALRQNSLASTAMLKDYMELDGELTFLPIRCSTCALVGTSGHLLAHEYGSEIDANHSCVFRLGFSPSKRGLERFVGSRTTARVVDSFSFFPFLKRPWKLAASPFASEAWILFHRRPGDISWYHKPLLSGLVRKYDTRFLWMTKSAEEQVHADLEKRVSNGNIKKKSPLWFGLKVVEDAGCISLDVYGVPDHQICKRHADIATPSLYWENQSAPLCTHGIDASFQTSRGFAAAHFPTVPERRGLRSWKEEHHLDNKVRFEAPRWPS